MRKLNIIFALLIFILLTGDTYLIVSYTTEGKSPSQAISRLATQGIKNTLEVVDSIWVPQLKRTDNYTSILVAGIDSRTVDLENGVFKGDSNRNTDTLMQIVYNHDTKRVFMISIPRDMGVTATDSCVKQTMHYSHSINYIYKESIDGKCPQKGEYYLQKYVSSITGFENHYFAIISFDAFKDIINTVGDQVNGKAGLYIDVPRTFREYYPREVGGGFESINFKQGYQFIPTDMLLKYARSRQATSDFDRARRQQQVVQAIEDKISSSSTLSDPLKLFQLYEGFSRNALFSSFSLDDVRAGLQMLKDLSNQGVTKIVLDDEFGGLNKYLTKPVTSRNGTHRRGNYYLSPVAYNSPDCVAISDEYCQVKKKLLSMFNNSTSEEAKVIAFTNYSNGKSTNSQYTSGSSKLDIPITASKTILPGREGWGYVQIYDFSAGNYPVTKEKLATAFQVEIKDGSTAPFKQAAASGADFAIIIKVN